MHSAASTTSAQLGLPASDERQLAAIEAFITRMSQPVDELAEQGRRRAPRLPYVVSVEMMPIDKATGQVLDEQKARVIARNISTSGIALVRRGFVDWPEMAVRLTDKNRSTLLVRTRVARIRSVGRNLYEVGGEFVERLEDPGRLTTENATVFSRERNQQVKNR